MASLTRGRLTDGGAAAVLPWWAVSGLLAGRNLRTTAWLRAALKSEDSQNHWPGGHVGCSSTSVVHSCACAGGEAMSPGLARSAGKLTPEDATASASGGNWPDKEH